MAINREKVLEAAQKFYEKKKYDKALVEYQKVIQEDPNDARILLKVGDLQSKMELYADAVATYEKVGKFYAAQGFALKAIAVYKQIRELIAKHVPQLEERYGHIAPKLAELYQQLGLVSDALAALDEVATRLQRQGKDAEAIETFRRVVELDPTNPLPHLRLAEALSRGQDVEGAVTEFSVAAGLLVNLGRRDDAIKVYERLLHHRLDADKARKAAELYLSRGQPNDGMQALAKLQICFQADPKNLDTLQLLAHAFFAIGQASKAIEVQKEMARIARDSGDTALFASIVNRLRQQAPNDETVVRMLAGANLHAQTAPVGFEPRVNAPPPPVPGARAMATAPMNVPGPFGNAQPDPSAFAPPPRAPTMSAPEVAEVSFASVPPEELEEIEGYEDEALAEAQRIQDEHDLAHAREQRELEQRPRGGSASMPPPSPETQARIAQILADAASFRRVRLYKKAIDTLNGGLELDPRSVELYETLRQVLYEARQEDQSIDVGLKLAALYVDALDGESAARVLQDVLALDPHHPRALEMLHELGYELAPEDEDLALVGDVTDAIEIPRGVEDYGEPQSDPSHGALPSYDLEEMGPRDVSHRYDQQRRVSGRPRDLASGGFDAVDDPFLSEAPLPSFPLDQPTGELDTFDAPLQDSYAGYDAHGAHGSEPQGNGARRQDETAHTASTAFPAPTSQSPEALEDALEEADFFASRGLFADARTILQDQMARHPQHPLLLERIAELDESEAAAGGEGGDGYGLSLDDLEAPPVANGGFSSATQQVDVEEVFTKFKEGVARQISIDDAQSHYDLGVAYKEMGLIDDAIREFETAARDESRETVCLSMVGMIELERGNVELALEAFIRGVSSRGRQPDQEMVLCFEIGACYELQNMNSEALGYYQRVLRRDSRYRDVEARVRRLSALVGAGHDQSQVRSSSGGDEDFERAFEDLLDEG